MHLFEAQNVGDYEAAARLIPVIDYGPYFAGVPGALERVAAEVAHACENVGFFYVLNHGVPDELIDRAFAASRRFHALPLDQKIALKLNENNIGYLPINASVQGASTVHKATKPNLNESFFISHDRGPEHPDVMAGKPLRGRNQWPRGFPGIRADMMAYFHTRSGRCATACCRRLQSHWAFRRATFHRSLRTSRTPTCVFCTTRRRMALKTTLLVKRRTPTTAS
jgi:isopenicillin N synthase-like dioxygenase